MLATIEPRKSKEGSTKYRVRVRRRGMRPVSRTFARKTDAKAWALQTEAAFAKDKNFPGMEGGRHMLSDLIDIYIDTTLRQKKEATQEAQRRQLNWWKNRLGTLKLSEVTPSRIAEARNELKTGSTNRGQERSYATVNRYMAALSHCFTIAVKELQWLEVNPMTQVAKFPEPKGRVRFLDEDERKRLLSVCRESQNKYLYLIVLLAVSTGMRRNEVLGLRWENLDLERGVATLHNTKNGERRAIPITGKALDLLISRSHQPHSARDYVFPAPQGLQRDSKPIDIQSAFNTAVKRAKLQDFRFHDLRHTTASYLAMNGATLPEIAAVLGHKQLQMVQRYAHVSEQHTASVLERMNRKVFGDDE